MTPGPISPKSSGWVARRVLRQLLRDPRFLALACGVPVLLVLLLKVLFEEVPAFRLLRVPIGEYALPAAGFFIFFLTYLLSTIVLVRERRDKTLERMLAAGYRRAEIVLGYMLGYGALALVQTALVVATTLLAFDLALGERLWPVAATTFALAMVSLALGLLVSTLARSEGQIFPTIPLLIVPSLLLSGLVIPLEQLPEWLRAVAYALPLTHAETVLLGLLPQGKGFAEVLGAFLLLLGLALALPALASLTVRAER